MDQANKNIEIKIPAFIPIIIITIFFLVTAKIYALNLNNEVEASTVPQELSIQEEIAQEEKTEVSEYDTMDEVELEEIQEPEVIENNVVEEEKEEVNSVQEDPQTITYTAPNGKKYEAIATLKIPSLGIEYPILSSTSEALLKVSLTKYWGANPNEVGNMVVLGHNYKNSKFFGKLPKIEIGSVVKITDLTGRSLDYKVYDKYIIDPNNNSCTSQLTNGQTEITLITCHYEKGNVHATKRFVVKAKAI